LFIVEFGAGSGQQTEFLEKELNTNGITKYNIIAFDKSYNKNSDGIPSQFDILNKRIRNGEISNNVIPINFDFDGATLPIKSKSITFSYMAHVLHHIKYKEQLFKEISRITIKNGRHFIFGVTIEDLKNHPLDEFFPIKYEYDKKRYPTEEQLKEMFYSAGLTYEEPNKIGKDQVREIDREFLLSIENTTMDSVLKIIKDNDPEGFKEGVQRIRSEVEHSEKSGRYRLYFTSIRRVFWGIKK
jgi:ubiquinone/menaquinone biosynthesis C-methylase UbiE